MLKPLSGRNAHIGAGAVYLGSVDLYLARLATTLRRWDVAEEHFDRAFAMHDAIGAKVFMLMTLIYNRGMLNARGAPGDAARAVALSRQALECAVELGVDEVAKLAASDLAISEQQAADEAAQDEAWADRRASPRCGRSEANEAPGTVAGGLAVLERGLPGHERGAVAVDPLHQPSTAGRQVEHHLRGVQAQAVEVDQVEVGALARLERRPDR